MPLSFVQRLLHTLAPQPMRLEGAVRVAVRPPLARTRSRPWRRRLAGWLASGLSEACASTGFADWKPAPSRPTALTDARAAFREALEGLPTLTVGASRDHIRSARSLHELWHLRAEIFNLVARHHSQGEADRRLARVDCHFSSSRPRRPGGAARDGRETRPPA